MSDVKDTASQIEGEATPQPQPQVEQISQPVAPVKEAEGKPEADLSEAKPVERTIPYTRFQEVNKRYRDLERKFNELGSKQKTAAYDPADLDSIRSHPYVQELELKNATAELRRGAEDVLSRYPQLPDYLRKAILKNPRGYVNESTTDVPNALLDIEDYILDLDAIQAEKAPEPKTFPVAGMNNPAATQGSSTPAEVQKIMGKPLDTWTEDEARLVGEHAKSKGIRLPD